jgi:hypothetical protein
MTTQRRAGLANEPLVPTALRAAAHRRAVRRRPCCTLTLHKVIAGCGVEATICSVCSQRRGCVWNPPTVHFRIRVEKPMGVDENLGFLHPKWATYATIRCTCPTPSL